MTDFTWEDGERRVRFGRGAIADAAGLLGDGYTLLTTARARGAAPELVAAAAAVHEIGPGLVDELAAGLLEAVAAGDPPAFGRLLAADATGGEGAQAPLLVALGGGRVIDVAKAIAAARTPWRVAAVPTTLSAAEMTRVHRHAAGVDASTPRVRPAIVINDPDLSASQPVTELAASAANALGHAVEGPLTVLASPVPTLAAREAARLIGEAFGAGGAPSEAGTMTGDAGPDREALALGALLSGYAIDAAAYGLHHVMSQTLVRVGGAGHAQANAILLPHTIAALQKRFPDRADPDGRLASLARALAERAGASRIRDVGVAQESLDRCAQAASERPELALTPPPADAAEIRAIYAAAW